MMKFIEKITNRLKNKSMNGDGTIVEAEISSFFKVRTIEFAGTIRRQESTTLEWQIKSPYSSVAIEEVLPGCGCTARITWAGSKVTAVFTNQEKKGEKPKKYKNYMTVWFKDGVPKEVNSKGVMKWPEDRKLHTKLFFSGMVLGE